MNDSCSSPSSVITNLPVRQNLSAAVSAAYAQGCGGAVIVLKVSDLTQINHWHGYEAGDKVIEAVMNRIEPYLSEGYFLSRLGGGHFLIFLRADQGEGVLENRVDHLM